MQYTSRQLGQILQTNPSDINACLLLAQAFEKCGAQYAAARCYHHSFRITKAKDIQAVVDFGNKAFSVQHYAKALGAYSYVLEMFPEQRGLMLNVAKCYNRFGNLKKSIEYYHKVLELSPDNSNALCDLVHLSQAMCEWDLVAKYKAMLEPLLATQTIPPFYFVTIFDDPVLQRSNAERFCKEHI